MSKLLSDEELRQKMQDIFNDCTSGWLITIKNFNGYERELGDMESEIIGDILDLIKTQKRLYAEMVVDIDTDVTTKATEDELRKAINKALHLDWAFKGVNGVQDKIIVSGTPKGAYHTSYKEFTTDLIERIKKETTKARIDELELAKISPKFKIEERIAQLQAELEEK